MARTNFNELLQKMLLTFITEPDPVQSMLKWMAEKLAEIEAENKVGAEKGRHSTERKTHFSGVRVRRLDTRAGTIYLVIPKLRKGGYIPFFITERKRSEAALIDLVQEAYTNGVSTRKIERLAKNLGIENISASQVSEINKGLDAQVQEFRNRGLSAYYPVIWVDALYEKIRSEGRVISTAILIVYGVNEAGKREILAVEPMYDESESAWNAVFEKLKARGLRKVVLVVSDAHPGIQKAARKNFIGSTWQRCKVHFMRNVMAKVKHKDKKIFAEKLKLIWLAPDKSSALSMAKQFMREYQDRYPEAISILADGLEDSLQFYSFPDIDPRKISSTNVIERLNREVRRRSRVVGVFPSEKSYVRLICCCLLEYSEDWFQEKSYLRKEVLTELKPEKVNAV